MKILVTGGAGFIGSYLVEKLIDLGNKVAIYDNFLNFSNNPEYYNHALSFRKKMFKNKPFKIFKSDIRNKKSLRKAFNQFSPEIVVDLAGLPMSRPPEKFEHLMIPVNVNGTLNVLDEFNKSDSAKRIIYTSSSMCYGHFIDEYQKEDVILNPVNPYGASKAACEYFVRLSNKEWVIIRPICVYGFTDCASRVTQLLIDAAMNKETAWIVEGEKLDFTYIDDVVDGYIKCITSPGAKSQVINISYGKAIPVTGFAMLIKSYFPDFNYEIRKPEFGQVNRGGLDITKAKELINFKPKYDIKSGLKKTIELMKQYGWEKKVYKR